MACGECLRRAWLLARVAGHIENVNTSVRGFRAAELLALESPDLLSAVASRDAAAIAAEMSETDPESLRQAIAERGCWSTCRHRPDYPASLRDLGDGSPHALLGRGDRSLLEAVGDPHAAVAIVGARKATSYGLGLSRELSAQLAMTELAIVSGMALGIDSEAHRGALEAGGLTAAVLAGGSDVAYPASATALHRQIGERGLALSEMPPGTKPMRWMFPARNRLIAGLAGMTVVVQAGTRSGSLITARQALELGREVGAIPGEVGLAASRGTNALIADGAALVSDAQDVLDRLAGISGAITARRLTGPPLDDLVGEVLLAVEDGCSSGDEIATRSGLAGDEVAVALAQLELDGYVETGKGGLFRRTVLERPPTA
jgi:DNA processing protein